ncbi:DUF6427 family protein [Joostella sp. CR20]|uniref:DUF6427 family protein n=1 Tax=Joostella sp. CR20 TaxID=2804312 RepID=UPI00313E97A9
MISSIFERTNPINFIILCIYTSLFLVGSYFFYTDEPFSQTAIFNLFQSLSITIASLFIIDFINRKNFLTKSNSFTLLFFVLLNCLFPKLFGETNIIIANLFVLLSFRRLVSIRSNKDVEIKIFDASLWIFVATLFYSWSLLFILLVFASIILYKKNDYRNSLIPFVTLLIVLIIVFTTCYLTDNLEKFYSFFIFSAEFDFEKYTQMRFIVPIIFMVIMGIWSTIAFFLRKQNKSFVTRVPGILIMIMLVIATLIALISENNNMSELIFLLFPLSVILAKCVENIQKVWLKEAFIWAFIVVPYVVLFL